MSKTLRRLWSDPVWSAVIATTIVAGVTAVGSYFLNWWPAIARAVGWCWAWLGAKTAVAHWLLGVLFLAAALWGWVLVMLLWQSMSRAPEMLTWKMYTTDKFFGLRWRWTWGSNGLFNLLAYCPRCDYQVSVEYRTFYPATTGVVFRCDLCGCDVGESREPLDQMQDKVERFIHQKVRTNTWPRGESGVETST